MSATQSRWIPEYVAHPAEMQAMQWTRTRERLNAIHANSVIGSLGPGLSGWDYDTSVRLAEPAAGSNAAPNRLYWTTPGTRTNKTEVIKAELSYTEGVMWRAAYWFSQDNGATYVEMKDELGYSKVDYTYDGAIVTRAVWGVLNAYEYLSESANDAFIDESGTFIFVTEDS